MYSYMHPLTLSPPILLFPALSSTASAYSANPWMSCSIGAVLALDSFGLLCLAGSSSLIYSRLQLMHSSLFVNTANPLLINGVLHALFILLSKHFSRDLGKVPVFSFRTIPWQEPSSWIISQHSPGFTKKQQNVSFQRETHASLCLHDIALTLLTYVHREWYEWEWVLFPKSQALFDRLHK